jgi:hypothetical protein
MYTEQTFDSLSGVAPGVGEPNPESTRGHRGGDGAHSGRSSSQAGRDPIQANDDEAHSVLMFRGVSSVQQLEECRRRLMCLFRGHQWHIEDRSTFPGDSGFRPPIPPGSLPPGYEGDAPSR